MEFGDSANGMERGNLLDRLLESLPQSDAAGIRDWLPSRADGGTDPLGLLSDLAAVGEDTHPAEDTDPRGIRRVGIIGGGTAGLMTALALKAKRPWLDVTLVESKSIPIIGVGEAPPTSPCSRTTTWGSTPPNSTRRYSRPGSSASNSTGGRGRTPSPDRSTGPASAPACSARH
jgi:hypothetical protein